MGFQNHQQIERYRYCSYSCFRPSANVAPPSASDDEINRHCSPHGLATCWEILFVASCSVITTSYTLHDEVRLNTPAGSIQQAQAFDPGSFSFIFDPSPGVLLGACIVEGCAISSFAYRRQAEDIFQAPLFVFAITGAIICGVALGINPNILMLGVIPWAVCLTMMTSASVHWLLRQWTRSRSSGSCCEVGEKEKLIQL
ncbi:hypothetical protein BJ875DRAFT_52213 [Amylocarpus encephaloides]|uniref:Uncharacterized protein n=1 Tax=Amylocarpus encephaloides TaxID=45428 RepID=A0A9P8C5P8_9HELO|nr:hypothetical protein BJ875DRAFT_52213 [Amylocarpus encephaloides]